MTICEAGEKSPAFCFPEARIKLFAAAGSNEAIRDSLLKSLNGGVELLRGVYFARSQIELLVISTGVRILKIPHIRSE